MPDERYTQRWIEIEAQFPGSSAAFDRDLGDAWLADRDGPRFDIYGPVLHVFAGDSDELQHRGPWASAYFDASAERWVVKDDRRPWVVRFTVGDESHEVRIASPEACAIGRGTDCRVRVDHDSVSRKHAILRWSAGQPTIADLGGGSGITVDGRRVHEAQLADGDVVGCGQVRLAFTRR